MFSIALLHPGLADRFLLAVFVTILIVAILIGTWLRRRRRAREQGEGSEG
jgi:hypothetical protein